MKAKKPKATYETVPQTPPPAPILVTIGIPTQDSVHAYFALSLACMVKETSLNLAISMWKGSNICQNRNTIVAAARQAGSKYLLFIDNDMSFPPRGVDRLVSLAEARGLDIIGCNYLFKSVPHHSMVVPKNQQDQRLCGLDEVDLLPTGYLLIRMTVFDRLEQPYFIYKPTTKGGVVSVGTEDYQFCDRARAAGIRIWMDTDLSYGLVHWGSPTGVRWIPEPPGYAYMNEPLQYAVAKGPEGR